MLGHRHEIARLQSDFYREKFRKIVRWLIVSVFIMFSIITAIIYFFIFQPTRQYYANTTDGIILPMPLSR